MPNQRKDNNGNQKGKSLDQWQNSGSDYHREHASNVPDYGANTMDPIAKNVNSTKETSVE